MYVLVAVLRPRRWCIPADRTSASLNVSKAKAVQIISFACLQAIVLMFVAFDHPTLKSCRLRDFGSCAPNSTNTLSNMPSPALRIIAMATQAAGKSTCVRTCPIVCVYLTTARYTVPLGTSAITTTRWTHRVVKLFKRRSGSTTLQQSPSQQGPAIQLEVKVTIETSVHLWPLKIQIDGLPQEKGC